MKPNLETLLKQAGTTAALLGGALVSCHFGSPDSPLVVTVIGGVLTNILSNKVEQSQLLKINEILFRQNPSNLNHDLEKLSIEALVWATKNICHNYQAYCTTNEQKTLLTEIKRQIIAEINAIDKTQWEASNELLREIDELNDSSELLTSFYVKNNNWPEINSEFPFTEYYESEFVKNFRLCFGELLKDKDHRPALIAYNRNISTQIQKGLQEQKNQIDLLLEGNEELKSEISRLSQSPQERFEKEIVFPKLNIALDEYLQPLHENVKLLIDINGNVLAGIEDLKKESQFQTQQIGKLTATVEQNLKNKFVHILYLIIALALSYFAFRYWQSSQPFVFTVLVNHSSENSDLPIEKTEVEITYGDKSEILDLHNKEAVFKGLPSYLRNDSIRVQIRSHGFFAVDTLVEVVNMLHLNLRRDDTYKYMKGRVKEALSGLPIFGAKVMIRDIKTLTDSSGSYTLSIPEAKQNTDQRLIISKEGYLSWERIEPVNKNNESIIQLKKQ